MRISLIIILLLIFFIIKELIKLNRSFQSKQKTKIKFITKPLLDKFLKDINDNDIVVKNNIYNKMFSNPSPWMLSRGIGLLDKYKNKIK